MNRNTLCGEEAGVTVSVQFYGLSKSVMQSEGAHKGAYSLSDGLGRELRSFAGSRYNPPSPGERLAEGLPRTLLH